MSTSIFFAEAFANEQIFKTMAWVFTMLSGVTSIALTIHKFGLSPAKRIGLIIGVISFGLVIVLLVIPGLSPFKGPAVISVSEEEQLQLLASELGDYSGGYKKTDDGFVSKPVKGEVNRVSEYVYAVMHPNGHFDAIYSGDFFEAQIDGKAVNCELIDVGKGRVLIVKGEEPEFVQLNSDQSENTFKVKKVPVQPKQA